MGGVALAPWAPESGELTDPGGCSLAVTPGSGGPLLSYV